MGRKLTVSSCVISGIVSNVGGKILYEEQTNVSKDGWQQNVPPGTCVSLCIQRGSLLPLPLNLAWPVMCFYQWKAAEVTLPVAGLA